MLNKHNKRVATTLLIVTGNFLAAQAPPGRGNQGLSGGAPQTGASAPAAGRGLGKGPLDQMVVDPVAADRARAVYVAECVNCHGPKARGGDQGADLIRSQVILHDRYGDNLGPFLKKGHGLQSGRTGTSLAQDQIQDLSHFLRQRLNESMNRAPGNPPPDILTGDAKAGSAWFHGAGKCTTCHQPDGDLKGIGSKYAPVDIQQHFLFPGPGGRGGRGAPVAAASPRATVTVTVTPPNGPGVTGVPDRIDDFNVTLRDAAGVYHSWARMPSLRVEEHDPLASHHALLAVITDKNMHDVVAYLETLK